ncbi:hypothetical protein [Streptomyces sp. MP131-18]|uniref:hypothetical protein n=1 Tax=Streptomyces sp. MP131-18 TaxID=1857892 RepID=UPI0011810E7C|nr:hypothetical protein [Streptomyces sp. MP131-18]
MNEATAAALFPPGEEVDVSWRPDWVDVWLDCVVEVDGTGVIQVRAKPSMTYEDEDGIAEFLEDLRHDVQMEDGRTVGGSPHEYIVWDDYAAIRMECAEAPERGFSAVNLSISLAWAEEYQDFGDELEQFLQPYAEDFLAAQEPGTCDPA